MRRSNADRASTLQIALSTGLISIFAILVALAAPANRKEASRRNLSGFQLGEGADALGNYPDTSILLSTDTTVTPDAAPTNTTSINVSTSTNFKGTLAGNPTTGVVRVTDAHPAGTYSVTVKAFNGGGPTATRTFTLTVTTPATCTPVSFAAARNFGAGDSPRSVAVGDFNGDGKQDLAVGNEGLPPPHSRQGSVWILLGNGAGNFSATNFAYGAFNHPVAVAVGDFNGDGKQDLAMTDKGVVAILLGDGAGNFSAPTGFAAGGDAVAVGDFNGDGKQDLAVTTGGVAILLGDGAGNFSAPTDFGAGSQPSSVAVGDFNGDGKQDLAVANQASANVSILLGDGAGNFSAPTNFGAGSQPSSVAVGDFNGDGKQDLAVANLGTYPGYNGTVSILLGNGEGSFSAPTNFGAGSQSSSVAVGDFNGDGKQDLAVANSYPDNNVSILLGDGAGNFSAASAFGAGTWPLSVAVGDFNGDGKQDLATANAFSGDVSILLRICAPTPTPTPSPTLTPTPTATATPTATPPCTRVISHSTSQAITTPAPFCLHPPPMTFPYDNYYWRAFNMQSFVGGAEYMVSSVSFGVYNGASTVIVQLFANNGAPFPAKIGTQIGTSTLAVNQPGTVVTTPLVATVPAGTNELVMLVHVTTAGILQMGANTAPETGPSYWSSVDDAGCSSTPGVISSHLIFNVYGTCTGPPPTPTPTPSPGMCGTLLYDQTSSTGTSATVSQNFEAANDAFDSQLADDFVVPVGSVWTIQRVNVNGVYFNGPGPAASVNVSFYSNSGTLPGAAVPGGTYTNLPMTDTAGNFSIPLPTNLVLSAGTYWVSVQAKMDFTPGGEWGWIDRTVTSSSPAAWQNPGGGFGFGCLSWGARAATCGIDVAEPDQIFQIIGCLGAPSPTPSPTPTVSPTPTPTPTPNPSPTPSPLPCGTFTFSNTTTISIPDSGAAAPYPSSIFIASAGIIQKVTVKLNNLSHTSPDNIDVLLVGPDGTNAIIMSDVGGDDDVTGVTLTLDDDAPNNLPASLLTSGTFKPTNIGAGDTWPAPAPAPSGGSALSAFAGRVTAGTWSLYVVDDTPADLGSIGGWELTITTNNGACVSISGSVSYCSNPIPGPVPNVTMTRTGTYTPSSTLTDASGNYTFLVLPGVGTNYTVTPTKAARVPGSANINTVDVLATQRHFLAISLLTGCRLTAADVNGDSSVNTQDIIAIQRFFLGLSTGIANVGKYKFTPANRTYTGITSNQTGQNYDTLVFGDVASPFAEP